MDRCALAVDYGTSSCRASLVDFQGQILAVSRQSVRTEIRGALAETDPDQAWGACVRAIREVLSRGRELAASRKSKGEPPLDPVPAVVGVSSLFGYLFLDEQDTPLVRGIIWMDTRADRETRELEKKIGPGELHRRTGRAASPELLGPLVLWTRRNRPETYRRIRRITGLKDELVRRITGVTVTDFAHLNYTLAWNPLEGRFDRELLEETGIREQWLPRGLYPWEIAGSVTPAAAPELDLPAGIPVICGTSDGSAAMYGGGILEPGAAVLVSGTTDVLMTLTREPRRALESRLAVNTGMIPGTWAVGAATGLSGGALQFWSGLLAGDLPGNLARAAELEPGAGGLTALPGLSGERAPWWEPGLRGGLAGLSSGMTPAHILRSLMEGTSYRLADLAGEMTGQGLPLRNIRLVGGGGADPGWNRIRADVLERPVCRMREPEATTLGTALFCVSSFLGESPEALSSRWMEVAEVYDPRPAVSETYRKLRREHRRYLDSAVALVRGIPAPGEAGGTGEPGGDREGK